MTCSRIAGSGYNLIIHSTAGVRCTFKGSRNSEQWSVGKTGVGLGVDLSWKKEEKINFAVVSATHKFEPEGDFLSGPYANAKVQRTRPDVRASPALLVCGLQPGASLSNDLCGISRADAVRHELDDPLVLVVAAMRLARICEVGKSE